jgi:hypothetical protein
LRPAESREGHGRLSTIRTPAIWKMPQDPNITALLISA